MTTDTPPFFQPLLAEDPREVGGYPLYARLGAGGMGRVYLSYTPGGRPVALKTVRPEFAEDPDFRNRFAQEVANARRIHGLYTAQVTDSGTEAETPWLVTAYVPGPSLQQIVREHGALPERTVLLLIGGIAEALQAIHGVGVVHRDLKPANVLIAADGPRVIDFGIARAADATVLTGTGFRIGSPAFMAPEQAQSLPVTPATDVFALGALAAYVAGGAPPFGEGPETAVLYRVVHEQADLSRVPAGLHALLLRCLAKRPEDRPTPGEIIEAARSHPAVGGRLRFADDWLPARIGTEITRRSDLPARPARPASYGEPQPATEAPTALLLGAPTPTLLEAPADSMVPAVLEASTASEASARRRRFSWKILLPIALVVLLGGTAGGLALANQFGKGKTADTATAEPIYTTVYAGTELTSPDDSYDFDIATGTVIPSDPAAWRLGHSSAGFRFPAESDVAVAENGEPTAAECGAAIDQHPVTSLAFEDLPAERAFCVRARNTRDIAVVRVVSVAADDGPVKISMDYYRNDA